MNKNINDSGRDEQRVITGDEENSSLEQEFEFLSLAECKDYWDQNSIRRIDTLSSTFSSYSMPVSDSEDPIALDEAENEQTRPFDRNRLKHRISEIEPKINDVCNNNSCIQEKVKHLEGAVDAMYAKKSIHREKCEEHSKELYRKGAEEKQQVMSTSNFKFGNRKPNFGKQKKNKKLEISTNSVLRIFRGYPHGHIIIRIMHLLLQIGAYALMHRKMIYVMLNLNVYVDKVQGLRLQKYSQNVGKIFDHASKA